MHSDSLLLLDGPLGTELAARGVPTPLPGWSAGALRSHPDVIRDIHRAYAEAGAMVHTANTFRTQPRYFADDWEELTNLAVRLAREGVDAAGGQVAGSISPLADCYRPDLSPQDPRPEHRLMAGCLADAGVDLLLVETFPHAGEALSALQEALETGLPTWFSLTAGPDADLMTPSEMRPVFAEAARLGAQALLVNCIPARAVLDFLPALQGQGLPWGAYANAGHVDEGMGWKSDSLAEDPLAAERYTEFARSWIEQGASIVGGCCGTGPEHVRSLARLR
jgi:S-methylmethionine-dependent homocysteine/selenocysteine methylase